MKNILSSNERIALNNNPKAKFLSNKLCKAFRKYKCKKNLPNYHQSLNEWDASITQPVITVKPSTPNRNDVLSEIPESIRKYYHIASHGTF